MLNNRRPIALLGWILASALASTGQYLSEAAEQQHDDKIDLDWSG